MKTSENAPRAWGSSSTAAASIDSPGCAASSAVSSSVSEVAWIAVPSGRVPDSDSAAATRSASSIVLVRLPLCARARCPVAVPRKVGWAFSQTLDPVVE